MFAALSRPIRDRPDAVRVADRRLSWERLLGAAGALAARIRGARAVAVVPTPSLEAVVAVAGALLAGVPLVLVSPSWSPAQRRRAMRESDVSALLGEASTGVGVPAVPVDLRATSTAGEPPARPERTALILPAGVTAGRPRLARVSMRALLAGLDALIEAWEWGPDDMPVCGLPLHDPYGLLLGILAPLRAGSALAHPGATGAVEFAGVRGSLYVGSADLWAATCADRVVAGGVRGARLLAVGGPPLTVPAFTRISALTGHRPVEWYGKPETLFVLSSRARGERRPGSAGVPLRGVTTRIVDEQGHELSWDGTTAGHLQVKGPMLFAGYVGERRPEPSGEDWVDTGDLAIVTESGHHWIVGRFPADLITSGRHRIGAGEVEQALLSHPNVVDAAVVGHPCPAGQQITAYVVAVGVTEQHLVDFVGRVLPSYKRPRLIRFVDKIPRDESGRVRERALITS